MYTSEQAILAMLASLGPQAFDAIVLECQIQATDKKDIPSVKAVLAKMIGANAIFTDGFEYSDCAEDFDPIKLIHVAEFLAKAF